MSIKELSTRDKWYIEINTYRLPHDLRKQFKTIPYEPPKQSYKPGDHLEENKSFFTNRFPFVVRSLCFCHVMLSMELKFELKSYLICKRGFRKHKISDIRGISPKHFVRPVFNKAVKWKRCYDVFAKVPRNPVFRLRLHSSM